MKMRAKIANEAVKRRSGGNRRTCYQKFLQRDSRGSVSDTVHTRRAKVTLEGGDDIRGRRIEFAARGNSVTVGRQLLLQREHVGAAVAGLECRALASARGHDPMADTGLVQLSPGKFLAGI